MPGGLPDRRLTLPEWGVVTPHETAARLVTWLLSDEVQLAEGPEAGGVLGWFDGEASGRFVYPEVTGYYLTFLSFLRAHGWPAVDLPYRARQAAGWLYRRFRQQSLPATRLYVSEPAVPDWRNNFSFSFDLAMIWRGIAMARQLAGPAHSGLLQSSLERRLFDLCSPEGGLLASVPIKPGPAVESWSTHPGAFQLKSAAALLCSGTGPPSELRRPAELTREQFRGWMPNGGERELLHPCLYFVEGALLLGAAGDDRLLRQAAAVLERLVRTAIEPLTDDALTGLRSDVLAQTLRSGCLLEAGGYLHWAAWHSLLPKLAAALCQYCDAEGRIYFQRDVAGRRRHVNVWSGLFAAQALIWYGHWRRLDLPLAAAAWLV